MSSMVETKPTRKEDILNHDDGGDKILENGEGIGGRWTL